MADENSRDEEYKKWKKKQEERIKKHQNKTLKEEWKRLEEEDKKMLWEQHNFTVGDDGIIRRTVKSGGKVYAIHNKRYAHGGKVSGRKATYKY